MQGFRRGGPTSARASVLQVVAAACAGVAAVAGAVLLQPGALTSLSITSEEPSFLRPAPERTAAPSDAPPAVPGSPPSVSRPSPSALPEPSATPTPTPTPT
ncbi:MAG: hypothetical protein IE926_15030, partial [Micrococcales bacterium]|nr:hypothetical protein [Micrococcales bacterium]